VKPSRGPRSRCDWNFGRMLGLLGFATTLNTPAVRPARSIMRFRSWFPRTPESQEVGVVGQDGQIRPVRPAEELDLGELPTGPCPTCGGGYYWRASVLSDGPGLWECARCHSPDPAVWRDACAIPVAGNAHTEKRGVLDHEGSNASTARSQVSPECEKRNCHGVTSAR
jgi:hypothetical protein